MSNVDKDIEFENIKFVKILRKKDSPFLHELQVIFGNTKQLMANRVPYTFPNFTLHNIEHSIRVADYMYEIVKERLDTIGEVDIVIMLYSAILHDIGMVVSKEEEDLIKNDNYLISKKEKYPVQLSGIKNIDWIKNIEDENEQEKYAIQEYIRKIHGFRAKQYIINLYKENNYFSIPSFSTSNFYEDLALICQSHNESHDWIKKTLKEEQIKGEYKYSPQFCACMLRLGDILDIDERRTPVTLLKNINPQGQSKYEWLQHQVIQNADKISHENGKINFQFIGECNDAKIHRKVYHYLDWVKEEVVVIKSLINKLSSVYFLDLNTDIIRKIEPKGNYTIPDNKMSIDYRAVSTLLMGENIYGDRKFGLRELLQNSMDACYVRLEIENRNSKIGDDKYIPCVKIILDRVSNEIRIKDNGIGMNMDTIRNHFLSIGKSYYKSDEFKIENYNYHPIGIFGIGFLACFMLSDKVIVKTKSLTANILYEIELEQGEEYSCIKEREDNKFEGTEIILDYNSVLDVFEDEGQIKKFIENNILTEEIKFMLCNENGNNELYTGFNKKYNHKKEFLINISDFIPEVNGFIIVDKKFPIYENIGDFNIKERILYYNDGIIISDLHDVSNISISKLTINNVLEYFEVIIYDDSGDYFADNYVFYDNNVKDSNYIRKFLKGWINKKLGKDKNKRKVEINLFQMYLYNDDKKYHYSIPYYSDHVESQYMVDIDDYKYNPLGDFLHNEFNLEGIFNNGIYVPNENFVNSVEYDHYVRFTGLDIVRYSLNIKSGLGLNVSRNSFNNFKKLEKIQYDIYRAAHIAMCDALDLKGEKRMLLESFIKDNFPSQAFRT